MTQAQHLLVAHDFSPPSDRALALARTLRKGTHAAVDVVHVHLDPFEGVRGAPRESIWSSPKQLEAYLNGLRDMLRKTVSECFGPDAQSVGTHVVGGQPVDQILDLAKSLGADLICVGTTGKSAVERVLLGSVTQRLVRQSKIPVLIAH